MGPSGASGAERRDEGQMSEVLAKLTEYFLKLSKVLAKLTEDFPKVSKPIFQMSEPPCEIDRTTQLVDRMASNNTTILSEQAQ